MLTTQFGSNSAVSVKSGAVIEEEKKSPTDQQFKKSYTHTISYPDQNEGTNDKANHLDPKVFQPANQLRTAMTQKEKKSPNNKALEASLETQSVSSKNNRSKKKKG